MRYRQSGLTGKLQSMTTKEIYENAGLLIGAGSETTATALTAATYFLTTHPDVLQKLTHEIRTSFQSEDEITIQGVQKLDYMLAVLDETMRLHPPSPVANLRQACSDGVEVGGRLVPGGVSFFSD